VLCSIAIGRFGKRNPVGVLPALFVSALLIAASSCSRQETVQPPAVRVTIDNVQPRRDVNGQIIDAHGG